MRVSLEWLSQYVDINGLSPEAIAEAITNAGLEVDAIERTGVRFTQVVVAGCTATRQHPEADRLRIATIDLGGGKTTEVVCGGSNLAAGQRLAFALEGASVINRKTGEPFVLGPAKIRGVVSCGMICSLEELGLEDQYDRHAEGEIWVINDLVAADQLGKPLEDALGLESNVILHTAPTANRGDWMSMLGVAREVAALFDRPLKPLAIEIPDKPPAADFSVAPGDETICTYYGGAQLNGCMLGPSPAWMQRRLEAVGVKVINNLVDITNYVMLETGQPLHAFDAATLKPKAVIGVRRAKAGETLTTLDEVARTLTEETVLITENDQPIALAGVMGGQTTEIGDQTSTVFLEAAVFTAPSNRKSAKSVGLRTEASARFERGVDAGGCRLALFRAVSLYQEIAGGSLAGLSETVPPAIASDPVPLRLARLSDISGIAIDESALSEARVISILEKLGFGVNAGQSAESLSVSVPSFRQSDVTREIDLIEEVIRIYGYDRVPYTLPARSGSVGPSLRGQLLAEIHRLMQGAGLMEIMTTSLIGPALLEKTGIPLDEKLAVRVVNSHATDHVMMRQSLIPNLLEMAKFNQSQGIEDIWVYELGRTYTKLAKVTPRNSGVIEKLFVSGLLSGNPSRGHWQQNTANVPGTDFYKLKGVVEMLLDSLALKDEAVFKADHTVAFCHPGKTARIQLPQGELGLIGEVHPTILSRMKFRQPLYVFELNVEVLFKAVKQSRAASETLQRLSPYPAVRRDMAFLLPGTHTHQAVLEVIHALNDPLLKECTVFDEYRAESLGDARSLAYRLTFRSDTETLKDATVEASVSKIKEALSQRLGVQFR
ncbi:MAG: phenylalanine--tRNA ligase subunit beta [Candidatus Melainabacteria bacterium]